MAYALGVGVEGGLRNFRTWLQEHKSFRLVMAGAGVGLSWAWSMNWASERSFPGTQSTAERLWAFTPFFLGTVISLCCLAWGSMLVWSAVSRAKAASRVSVRTYWAARTQVKLMVVAFVAGTALNCAVGLLSANIPAVAARASFLVVGAALWMVLVDILFNVLQRKAPEGSWRKLTPLMIAPPMVGLALTALLAESSGMGTRSSLVWVLRAALALSMMLIPASAVAGLLPLWLVRRGQYGLALQANRMLFWAVGHTPSMEGWILSLAGRYTEARTYLRPLAFDEQGEPRLTSPELFLYAMVLSIQGEDAQAEELFEAAIKNPQATGDFHFGLAELLLTRKDGSERARELVEAILAGYPAHPQSIQLRSTRSQMLAFHSWALAANGMRGQAEARIQEAAASTPRTGKFNRAAIEIPIGDTWATLGEREKARASYHSALVQFPTGDLAARARRKMTQLDSRCGLKA
jgi:Flp pilus assembly protein TadD